MRDKVQVCPEDAQEAEKDWTAVSFFAFDASGTVSLHAPSLLCDFQYRLELSD